MIFGQAVGPTVSIGIPVGYLGRAVGHVVLAIADLELFIIAAPCATYELLGIPLQSDISLLSSLCADILALDEEGMGHRSDAPCSAIG